MTKYICPVEGYPNCRAHDCGYYATTHFFDNKEELMEYALKYIADVVIMDIFDIDGNDIGRIEYEIDSHNCTGIKLNIEEKNYRTQDNDSGKLIWVEI